MKNTIYNFAILALLLSFGLTSCDKDDDDNEECPTTTSTSKSVMLEFDFKMGDTPFVYDTVYDMNGVNVSFSEVRFYLSDFMLHDDGDNMDMLGGAELLDAGAEENTFTVGTTDFSHIHELHMLLGLNETVNHEDPITAEAPLNDASMHWGWDPAGGYKFVKTEVMIDTDGNGIPETAASIHCATDPLKRDIMLSAHSDVDGDHAHIHITADIMDFYDGVDFLNLTGTHGSSDLTNGIADNISEAFEIE